MFISKQIFNSHQKLILSSQNKGKSQNIWLKVKIK